MCKPCRNGKEGRIWSVSRCRWFAATATFSCCQCVCVVCAREKEERLKSLCLLFYELGLYVWFLWGCALVTGIVPEPASSVIPVLAGTRGPSVASTRLFQAIIESLSPLVTLYLSFSFLCFYLNATHICQLSLYVLFSCHMLSKINSLQCCITRQWKSLTRP